MPGEEPPPGGPRFFLAEGRGVEVREVQLAHDKLTNGLTIAGGNRREYSTNKYGQDVIDVVTANPGKNVNGLKTLLKEIGVPERAGGDVLKGLVQTGKIHTYPGRNKAIHHVISDGCDAPKKCLSAKTSAGLEDG